MAIAYVQKASTGTSAEATTKANSAFSGSVTSGNLIVVAVGNYGTTSDATGVADNKGNTYTRAVSLAGGSCNLSIWYKYNCTGGSGLIITATFAASNWVMLGAVEVSGIVTETEALDKVKSATSNVGATYTSSQTTTTDTADEFLFGAVYDPGGQSTVWTQNASWTAGDHLDSSDNETMFFQYRIVSSTGTYEANGTTASQASNSPTIIATFRGGGGILDLNASALSDDINA
jgi:hypothetical protein